MFNELGLSADLLKAIEDMGFEEPSPIQALAIPALLAGGDVLGQAQTGTGKTAAFGLPILEKLTSAKGVQALILCPTRELAIQVAEELGKLAARKRGACILPVYGGQPIERQCRALERGAQVVVGTPGRVLDHLERGTLRLDNIRVAVLDEADEMLDMGFREDMEAILERTPADCQRVLFSATMPAPIRELSLRFLRNPQTLAVAQKMLTAPAIEQVYYEVRPYQKTDALCRVLDAQGFRKALVFCSTKRAVDEVSMQLQQRGYQADGLHGNLAQSQRDRVMGRFRTDGLDILVATDVAARGIDVEDVDAVINYDIPHDAERYVHRIGRTGRAGREGRAFTFVTLREHYKMRDIIRSTRAQITQGRLPTLRDVDAIRTSRLLEKVAATLDEGLLERWLLMVEEFMAERSPDGDMSSREVAAALLKMLMHKEYGAQEPVSDRDPLTDEARNERGERRDRPDRADRPRYGDAGEAGRFGDDVRNIPMSRLDLNVGRAHKVTPREIVGAITGECGISSRNIGAISIQQAFSVVEIAEELAESVLTVLNRGVFIGGVKITAKPDTGSRPMRPRPARPGGQRPGGQRPGGQRPAGPRPAGPRPGGQRPAGPRPAGPRSDAPRETNERHEAPRAPRGETRGATARGATTRGATVRDDTDGGRAPFKKLRKAPSDE